MAPSISPALRSGVLSLWQRGGLVAGFLFCDFHSGAAFCGRAFRVSELAQHGCQRCMSAGGVRLHSNRFPQSSHGLPQIRPSASVLFLACNRPRHSPVWHELLREVPPQLRQSRPAAKASLRACSAHPLARDPILLPCAVRPWLLAACLSISAPAQGRSAGCVLRGKLKRCFDQMRCRIRHL